MDLFPLIMPHVKGGNDEWKREGEAAVAFQEPQPETSRCQRSGLLGQVVSTSPQKSFFFFFFGKNLPRIFKPCFSLVCTRGMCCNVKIGFKAFLLGKIVSGFLCLAFSQDAHHALPTEL